MGIDGIKAKVILVGWCRGDGQTGRYSILGTGSLPESRAAGTLEAPLRLILATSGRGVGDAWVRHVTRSGAIIRILRCDVLPYVPPCVPSISVSTGVSRIMNHRSSTLSPALAGHTGRQHHRTLTCSLPSETQSCTAAQLQRSPPCPPFPRVPPVQLAINKGGLGHSHPSRWSSAAPTTSLSFSAVIPIGVRSPAGFVFRSNSVSSSAAVAAAILTSGSCC